MVMAKLKKKLQDNFTGLSFCPYGYNQPQKGCPKCVALILVRHFSHFSFVTFSR